MKTLNIEELISSKNINSNEIINSTVDISKNSILFINNQSLEKLDKLIREALDRLKNSSMEIGKAIYSQQDSGN